MFMKIGITGNSELGKQKLVTFFENNYSFSYIDVDSMFKEIIKKHKYMKKINSGDWKKDPTLFIEVKNELEAKLKKRLFKIADDETAILHIGNFGISKDETNALSLNWSYAEDSYLKFNLDSFGKNVKFIDGKR